METAGGFQCTSVFKPQIFTIHARVNKSKLYFAHRLKSSLKLLFGRKVMSGKDAVNCATLPAAFYSVCAH